MLLEDKCYYHDPVTGDYHPVKNIVSGNDVLEEGYYYILGDHVYPYVGKLSNHIQFSKNYTGGIALIKGTLEFQEWKTEDEFKQHTLDHLTSEDLSIDLDRMKTSQEYIKEYLDAWDDGRNLPSKIRAPYSPLGDIYIPLFRDEDFPLEQILKRMIVAMKIVSSDERKKMSDDYKYDNMVSSLDGATKHTSILKFLDWANLLELDWEFSVFDISGNPYPLGEPIIVTNRDDGWQEIPAPDSKDYFVVPCEMGEDPYKRLIKLALWKKCVPTAYYRKKGGTSHQINNMKSALKSKQKMTSDYFSTWCELLDMGSSFTLTNKDGIWFKAVGYDITTNYEEDSNG